jgi:hypothetical protein
MSKPIQIALFASLVALAAPTPALFDGRKSDSLSKATPSEVSLVKGELQKRLNQPYLKMLASGAKLDRSSDFEVRQSLSGSFTRKGAKQKAYLYRCGLTSGVVILDRSQVVGHYNGIPAEYAFYVRAGAADLNGDGMTDLVLQHNTEDSEAVEADFFVMTSEGPRYLGSSPVFHSNLVAGEDKPIHSKEDAYRLSAGSNSREFTQEHFRRQDGQSWKSLGKISVKLEQKESPGFEPRLLNLTPTAQVDQAQLQMALNKLTQYADVGSCINYAKPANAAQAMVASDPGLRLMELLDTRAAVYAHENATKQQVDHAKSQSFGLDIARFSSAEQIRQAYRQRTNQHLGGMSPYLGQ